MRVLSAAAVLAAALWAVACSPAEKPAELKPMATPTPNLLAVSPDLKDAPQVTETLDGFVAVFPGQRFEVAVHAGPALNAIAALADEPFSFAEVPNGLVLSTVREGVAYNAQFICKVVAPCITQAEAIVAFEALDLPQSPKG